MLPLVRRVICFLVSLALLCTFGCGGGGSTSDGGNNGGGGNGGGGSTTPTVRITNVYPLHAMVGFPLGSVTLVGENFAPNLTLLFDGVAVPTRYYSDKKTIEFDPPSSAWNVAAVHTLQLTDPAGNKSNVAQFEYYVPQPGPDLFNAQRSQYMDEALPWGSLLPDLNGDGRADLVVVGLDSNQNAALLVRDGKADGTFANSRKPGNFTLQAGPYRVLSGDFNGDNHPDLLLFAVGSYGAPSTYQVLLNDGTGNFRNGGSGSLPTDMLAVPAAVGDFNHDGKLDFAYGASTTGQPFTVFFGSGDGTFASGVPVGADGTIALTASSSDLNRDGYTDLLYLANINGTVQLRVVYPLGNQSFIDVQPSGMVNPTLGFALADFNGDQIPDLFMVDSNGMGHTYAGVGDGTFRAIGTPVYACDGYLARAPFVVGDFDHDGHTDIATRATLGGPDQMLFLWGDGAGNFTPQGIISDHSFYLQAGDITGDGIPDIVGNAESGFAYPTVTPGRKDRNFPTGQTLIAPGRGWLSAGNVMGDGFNDLLVSGANDGYYFWPGAIFHAQPDGTFATRGQAPSATTMLADLDGDGLADMVGTTGTSVTIWKGDGSGQFAQVADIPVTGLPNAGFSVRDMDRDGRPDIVMPKTILWNKGGLQFDAASVETGNTVLVGDFDGDGIGDIVTNMYGLLFGKADRTFERSSTPMPNVESAFSSTTVADVNGDGKDDLILGNSNYIVVSYSTGRAGFVGGEALLAYGYAQTVSSVIAGDFNGDGRTDLAVSTLNSDEVLLFTNDGTGKFKLTTYAVGVNPVLSLAADFNHDGKLDLALENYGVSFKPPIITVLLHR